MAVCDWCNDEMTDENVHDCSGNRIVEFPDGAKMPAVLFAAPPEEKCHDCKIIGGHYHHPGCDMERCPRCHGQLISCGCLNEDEEDE